MNLNKNNIGLLLFVLYFLQYSAQIEFQYLEQLQNNSTYRHWSGLALFLLILHQWLLPIYRVIYDMEGEALEKKTNTHNWLGAISPLVFFLHSAKPNYGLLLILSILFFLNLLFGLLNDNISRFKHFDYYGLGIALHILLSATILILSFLHIWIVFFFN